MGASSGKQAGGQRFGEGPTTWKGGSYQITQVSNPPYRGPGSARPPLVIHIFDPDATGPQGGDTLGVEHIHTHTHTTSTVQRTSFGFDICAFLVLLIMVISADVTLGFCWVRIIQNIGYRVRRETPRRSPHDPSPPGPGQDPVVGAVRHGGGPHPHHVRSRPGLRHPRRRARSTHGNQC